MTRTWQFGRPLVLPVALLLLWEVLMAGTGSSEFLARPSDIARTAGAVILNGLLFKAALETFTAAVCGLLIGGSTGVLIGLLLGLYPTFAKLSEIPFETLRPIPSVALIPLSLLAFGFGLSMEVAVVTFGCFWPTAIYSMAAARQIEPRLQEVSRNLGLTFWRELRSVIVPAALPTVFVGVRLAAALALVISVTVEVTANPRGLGYAMIIAQQTLKPDLAFAFLFWIGVIGLLMNYGLLSIQQRLFPTASGRRPP
jgi:ABC-type nitrate/sulfonate/bicarbonate transport system permease component